MRLVLSLAFVLGMPTLAHGADATSPGPTPSREALVREGLALRRARQDTEALAAFQRAFALAPSAMIRAQIALAEQALGRWIEAERDLESALQKPDTWVEANRPVLTRALSVIQSHLAWLEVTSNLASSELWLDGEHLVTLSGSASEPARRVIAGAHRLALVAPDGRRLERSFELRPGSTYTYHAEWPEPSPEANARPEPVGVERRPLERRPKPQENARIHTTSTNTRRTVAYASAAVAVIALGEAIAASLLRLDYVNHYNGPSCYPQRSVQCGAYRDVANTLGTAALVGYAIAGAATVGSVTLFAWPERADRPAQVGVVYSGKF